jgi:transposase-like protein
VDSSGEKHVLGLWPGATENSEVCGTLLDELLERGLNRQKHYLFVLDGAKALKAAVVSRFGSSVLIQRCWIHKERNIRQYLTKSQYHLLSMRLKAGVRDERLCRSRKRTAKGSGMAWDDQRSGGEKSGGRV